MKERISPGISPLIFLSSLGLVDIVDGEFNDEIVDNFTGSCGITAKLE